MRNAATTGILDPQLESRPLQQYQSRGRVVVYQPTFPRGNMGQPYPRIRIQPRPKVSLAFLDETSPTSSQGSIVSDENTDQIHILTYGILSNLHCDLEG